MSCFVGEPPTLGALQGRRCAGNVVDAKLLAVAVAEIELGQIAVQVGFAHVLVDAVGSPFQDRGKAPCIFPENKIRTYWQPAAQPHAARGPAERVDNADRARIVLAGAGPGTRVAIKA